MKPSIGRIVHVNIGTLDTPEWRAALITRVWSDTCVQVTLFLDLFNDSPERYPALTQPCIEVHGGTYHARSLSEGEDILNWCWPPRV